MGRQNKEEAADHDATPTKMDTDRCQVRHNANEEAGDNAAPREINANRRSRRNARTKQPNKSKADSATKRRGQRNTKDEGRQQRRRETKAKFEGRPLVPKVRMKVSFEKNGDFT